VLVNKAAFAASQMDWDDFQVNHRDEWLECLRSTFDGLSAGSGRIGVQVWFCFLFFFFVFGFWLFSWRLKGNRVLRLLLLTPLNTHTPQTPHKTKPPKTNHPTSTRGRVGVQELVSLLAAKLPESEVCCFLPSFWGG
jgi:hypothetical protein